MVLIKKARISGSTVGIKKAAHLWFHGFNQLFFLIIVKRPKSIAIKIKKLPFAQFPAQTIPRKQCIAEKAHAHMSVRGSCLSDTTPTPATVRICELVRSTARVVDASRLDLLVLRGGAENALVVSALREGASAVCSSFSLNVCSPLWRYLQAHPRAAEQLYLKVGTATPQIEAQPGVYKDADKPHLKYTIVVVPMESSLFSSAGGVRQAVLDGDWRNLEVSFVAIHTSNFNVFDTTSGDVFLCINPKAGCESLAQPELQSLATDVATSGHKPEALYADINSAADHVPRASPSRKVGPRPRRHLYRWEMELLDFCAQARPAGDRRRWALAWKVGIANPTRAWDNLCKQRKRAANGGASRRWHRQDAFDEADDKEWEAWEDEGEEGGEDEEEEQGGEDEGEEGEGKVDTVDTERFAMATPMREVPGVQKGIRKRAPASVPRRQFMPARVERTAQRKPSPPAHPLLRLVYEFDQTCREG